MGKYNYMNLNQKMIRIRKKVPKLIRKRYSEDVTYDFVKLDDIYECLTPALNKYGVDFDILSERPTQMDEQGNSVFLKEMGALWRYEADLGTVLDQCRPSGRQGTELFACHWNQ